MTFSLKLKELRESRNLSQAQLAKDLGVGVGSVGMWESTERIPPSKKLVKIAKYFNCTTDYLLGADEWTAEERAQGVIDHKKLSVSADEETLLEFYRTIGRKFGKKKQENFIKLAELYAEEEGKM